MDKMRELTKAELQIMQVLWRKERAFVNEIREDMPEPRPAYNTISTVLRVLVEKEFVSYQNYGKTYQYFPLVNREDYRRWFLFSPKKRSCQVRRSTRLSIF